MPKASRDSSGNGKKQDGNGHCLTIGPLVRGRRKELGLKLREVSDRTGLSVSFLSLVERNKAIPSLSSLGNICSALEVGLDYFLTAPTTNDIVVYEGQRDSFSIEGSPVKYTRISNEFPGVQLHSVLVQVPPGWEGEMTVHEGEDFAYMLSGELMMGVGNDEFILKAGDTIHHTATIPHNYANRSDKEAVYLFVGTQPLFTQVREYLRPQNKEGDNE